MGVTESSSYTNDVGELDESGESVTFLPKRENIYLNAHFDDSNELNENKETTTDDDDDDAFPNSNCIVASITVETSHINKEVKIGK